MLNIHSTLGSGGSGYPLSSTPAASAAGSGGGKMKRERSSARPSSKRPEDDEVRFHNFGQNNLNFIVNVDAVLKILRVYKSDTSPSIDTIARSVIY